MVEGWGQDKSGTFLQLLLDEDEDTLKIVTQCLEKNRSGKTLVPLPVLASRPSLGRNVAYQSHDCKVDQLGFIL